MSPRRTVGRDRGTDGEWGDDWDDPEGPSRRYRPRWVTVVAFLVVLALVLPVVLAVVQLAAGAQPGPATSTSTVGSGPTSTSSSPGSTTTSTSTTSTTRATSTLASIATVTTVPGATAGDTEGVAQRVRLVIVGLAVLGVAFSGLAGWAWWRTRPLHRLRVLRPGGPLPAVGPPESALSAALSRAARRDPLADDRR